MRYLIALVLMFSLVGCNISEALSDEYLEMENNYYKTRIKMGYKRIIFWQKTKHDNETLSVDLTFDDITKLSRWADNLIECDGYYTRTYYPYVDSSKPYTEKISCRKTELKGAMIKEYDDGWFCDRCRKERKEELKKKLESLK